MSLLQKFLYSTFIINKMGITPTSFNAERELFKKLKINYEGLSLCELGNQKFTFKRQSGKQYYLSLGVNHVSLDLNGKDGAIPLDLDVDIPKSFSNKFEVVTDYGTIEHVNNQYGVFKNVHNLCKEKGVMIHVLPHVKSPNAVSERYYFSQEFMEGLAKKNGYKILELEIYKDPPLENSKTWVIRTVFFKTKNTPFVSKNEFESIRGVRDSGNLRFTGNYERKLSNGVVWYLRVLRNPKNIKRKLSEIFSKRKN